MKRKKLLRLFNNYCEHLKAHDFAGAAAIYAEHQDDHMFRAVVKCHTAICQGLIEGARLARQDRQALEEQENEAPDWKNRLN